MAKKPCDPFATLLMRLRKARKMSALALSKALDLSDAYIYRWEHTSSCRVNRQVLERVVTILGVSSDERKELFRLADRRDAPESAKDLYQPTLDLADSNLLQALLEIDHEWPAEPDRPNPRGEHVHPMLDAAAWTIARSAARFTDALPPFKRIRWPESIVRLGVVPRPKRADDPIDIPESLLHDSTPFLDRLTEPITPDDVVTQSWGMARVYRRLLFSNMERARTAVGLLQHWSCHKTQNFDESLSLRFRATDLHERYGMVDITCRVASTVGRRLLANYLWIDGNNLPYDTVAGRWYVTAEWIDQHALWEISRPIRSPDYYFAQDARDTIFIIRSANWEAVHGSLAKNRRVPRRTEPQLEKALRKNPLCEHKRITEDSWTLAVVPPELLVARARAWETILPQAPAVRRLFDGTDPPELTGLPKRKAKKPARKALKRTSKGKKATQKKKRKN